MKDPSRINFKAVKDFNASDLEPVFERELETPFDLTVGPLWRAILLDEVHVDETTKLIITIIRLFSPFFMSLQTVNQLVLCVSNFFAT